MEEDLEPLLQSAFRYALALTHDAAEAQDLVHDSCVAVMNAGAKWDKPYLFAAVRNRYIDRYRKSRKLLFVPIEGDQAAAEIADEFAAEPDVIEFDSLHRALEMLRPDEREMLFLSAVEGYTAQEIADMTSRPRGTILSLLHRTKQKLRRLLRHPGAEARS
ncbi:MAG TPA: RNA polymerase sigma factor [Thermoanaerobaculia bacterium]|jgi:RNA polymerase sigma-70 factor (ECF subfamily)